MRNTLKKLWTLALIPVLMMGMVSCEDSLQVEPRQSIDADIALNTREGLAAAINSVYARLRAGGNYGTQFIVLPEVMADNAYATNNSGRWIGNYQNNPGAHMGPWANNYFAINEINMILDALSSGQVQPTPTEAQLNQWRGEMHFLRGLYHFDLVRIYAYMPGAIVAANERGGVPIMTQAIRNATDAFASLPARAPINDVYAFVVAELNQAINLLPAESSSARARDSYFATRGGAHALLSRVALYSRNYSLVESASTAALASVVGSFTSGAAYVAGWRAEKNPESMFEVRFAIAAENIGVNEALQTSFTTIQTLGSTATGGWGDAVPNLELLNELGIVRTGTPGTAGFNITGYGSDVRAQLYDVGPGRGSGRKVEVTKFMGKSGLINLDNVPVIRKSEMYLNRAEARATAGSPVFNQAGALADLNTIRTARGLAAVNLSGTALLEEIIRQRRLEFAFEGHRFFDLKRLGRDITKPATQTTAAVSTGVLFTDFRILPPLPQRELDGNPNLVNNPGY
jgi:starch-binding outer membrane protein, SusD/RagB family